ncbi:MAG: hypothetical protein V7632_1201 [Bradyrhizobium sp.]|jgi:hypothetical protein
MRRTMLAVLAVTAFGSLAGFASSAAAAAYDYPWCAQGRQEGYPGDCNYRTYEQCQASVSGRDAYCGVNPSVAFGQQRMSPRPYR